MKCLLLSIFVICAVLVTVHSLRCYMCGGTDDDCNKYKLEANKIKNSTDCPGGTCIRAWRETGNKTIVSNYCGTEALCEAAKNACNGWEKTFNNCAVDCCDSDYCNAGSSVSFSVFLMTISSALGLALLK